MRMFVFAALAMMSVSSIAQSREFPPMSGPESGSLLLAQNYNSTTKQTRPDRDRPRRERFVCVVTPPDSARRNRPYVCPAPQGRVGGRCRCSGVVGNGNLETEW
jgi:hypothetical protein